MKFALYSIHLTCFHRYKSTPPVPSIMQSGSTQGFPFYLRLAAFTAFTVREFSRDSIIFRFMQMHLQYRIVCRHHNKRGIA